MVDNLANAKREALIRVEAITSQSIPFYLADVTDRDGLDQVFRQEAPIDAVIHFAASKQWVNPVKTRRLLPSQCLRIFSPSRCNGGPWRAIAGL